MAHLRPLAEPITPPKAALAPFLHAPHDCTQRQMVRPQERADVVVAAACAVRRARRAPSLAVQSWRQLHAALRVTWTPRAFLLGAWQWLSQCLSRTYLCERW